MAESRLISFRFHNTQAVRVLEVYGNPWFVASDVCTILGIVHAASSLRLLDDDEKGVHSMHTLGGEQRVTIINESGMYALILRSRKPEAKQFRKWVTSEVLPAIRKTGRYEEPAKTEDIVTEPLDRVRAPRRGEFLAIPFIDVNSPFSHWCLPLEGDYFSGYETGRRMALQYLSFLRDNRDRVPGPSFIPFILETFMKRFQCLNGTAFMDAPLDAPLEFQILRGHYSGFFGTVGHAAWLAARQDHLPN